MGHKRSTRDTVMKIAITCIAIIVSAATLAIAQDGAALYRENCATCHDTGANRAPTVDALRSMRPERVLDVLEHGAMVSMANRMTPAARRTLAEFVTGKKFDKPLDTKPAAKAMCSAAPGSFTNSPNTPSWNGWGVDTSNTRFQPSA